MLPNLFKIILAILLICHVQDSNAQFGKLKKLIKAFNDSGLKKTIEETTGQKLSTDNLFKKAQDAYAKQDTASFNFALAAIDNVSFYEDQNNFKEFIGGLGLADGNGLKSLTAGSFFSNDSEKDQTEEGAIKKAKRLKISGEMAFGARKFKVAEFSFKTGIELLEEYSIPDQLLYVKFLGNLGLLYQAMGRFNLAEEFNQKALEQVESMTGNTAYSYSSLLNNISVLYKDQGKYAESEKLIEQSLKLQSEADGNSSVFIVRNNKAILYQTLGRNEEAIEILEDILSSPKRERVKKSTTYQRILINLALIYEETGEYDRAEDIYLQAIELKEDQWKKNHPDYAHLLTNLASLYLKMDKNSEKVESLLLKARDVYKSNYGSNHYATANVLSNLGNYYRSIEEYGKAAENLEKASGIRSKIYPEGHPILLTTKEDLAILKWQMDELNEAGMLYNEVIDATLNFIHTNFPSMSEVEKTKFWNSQQSRFYRFYSFIKESHEQTPELAGRFLEIQLQTKGILLSASTKIKRAILEGDDAELRGKYLSWLDLRENLSELYSYSNEQLIEEDVNLDSLEQEVNTLEKWLSESTHLFQGSNVIEASQLSAILGDDEAIVDLVRFPEYKNGFTGEVHYAAIISRKGNVKPDLVFLENGNDLEGKFFKYYRNVITHRLEDQYAYENYWSPIDQKLQGIKTVYLSKDGIYNQISLPTLITSENTWLLNSKSFVLLSNSSDLLELKSNANSGAPNSAFLMGYPKYGSDEIAELPGTLKEVENIEKILKLSNVHITKYTGSEASEENLPLGSSSQIMHIATHGFFLEDASQAFEEKVFGINPDRMQENVFLRSGLMLAGAGVSDENYDFERTEDGIATAYEILNYQLDNVDLVVLSACETGLGEIKAGEGVYGLQRSFLMAGAKTLLMSLWKVDDNATQDFMTAFYQNWVRQGDKYEAFRYAQTAMSQKYNDPYYWGAFVIMGR